MTVRTRFAPSPTGHLHIGGVRTALFSWLYARHTGGRFVLRIEDTDRERSTEEAVRVILEGMRWLRLDHDEGPYFQTERMARYRQLIDRLLEEGKAYRCYCTREELDSLREEQMRRKEKPRYDGRCRTRSEPRPGVEPVVRFRNPDHGTILVDDIVRGKVVFYNAELDDLIIARADGTPTYNFTVVVDDMDMGITHVIRGDDHLNNTPRQINIFRALGAEPPRYAHVPMILGPDGKKLSKRHGALSVLQYREEGYLPQALLNYLVRLGWSHGDQEIFTLEEMIELFDIADVNPSASTFNPDKLLWVNQQHLKMAGYDDVEADLRYQFERQGIEVSNGPDLRRLFEIQKERTRTLAELVEQSRTFFEEFTEFDPVAAKKHLRPAALEGLHRIREALMELEDWSAPALHQTVVSVAEALGLKLGKLAQPLRVAVTGSAVSPSIDATLELLGKKRTLERLARAIAFIEARAQASSR